jgi:hypothetical protein
MEWSYLSAEHAAAGARPPRPMAGEPPLVRSLPPSARGFARRWRLIESGVPAVPGDCPAIRGAAAYGWAILAPGAVTIERMRERLVERQIGEGAAAYGHAGLRGDQWPGSDSGLVASWISGSDYVKVQTGIVIHYARDQAVFQGPLPFGRIENKALNPLVTTGIERGKNRGKGHRCELNVIVRLPSDGECVHIACGQAIGWFFLVAMHQRADPAERPLEDREE